MRNHFAIAIGGTGREFFIFLLRNRMLILKQILKPYEDSEFIIRLKARFILFFCITALVIIPVIMMDTAYFQIKSEYFGYKVHIPILVSEFIGIFFTGISLFFLIRGHFSISSHLIVLTSLGTMWAVLFQDKSSPIARVDTISYVFCILSTIPLIVLRKRRVIFLYSAVNALIFIFFAFLVKYQCNLSYVDWLDYISDE